MSDIIRVGILRGGVGEYESSLESGSRLLREFSEGKLPLVYKAKDMLLDRDGSLHIDGRPVALSDVPLHIDIVWNTLHGLFGEDGKIQQLLNSFSIPHTDSSPLVQASMFERKLARELFRNAGGQIPQGFIVSPYREDIDGPLEEYLQKKTRDIFSKLSFPWVVKPLSRGNYATRIAHTYHDLHAIIVEYTQREEGFLVEELLSGTVATCLVVDRFRDKSHYALSPVVMDGGEYTHQKLSIEEKHALQQEAEHIHRHIGLQHFSQVDMIFHHKKGVHVLEVSTIPRFTEHDCFEYMFEESGLTFGDFIDHVVQEVLDK
ncbi:MAG: D-alanine-D-alanine ligase [Flavobacteriaceae bacterium]|jgi:D-alanine-D-alanine ligase